MATAAGSGTRHLGRLPRGRHELPQEAAVREDRLRTKLPDPQAAGPTGCWTHGRSPRAGGQVAGTDGQLPVLSLKETEVSYL